MYIRYSGDKYLGQRKFPITRFKHKCKWIKKKEDRNEFYIKQKKSKQARGRT